MKVNGASRRLQLGMDGYDDSYRGFDFGDAPEFKEMEQDKGKSSKEDFTRDQYKKKGH